MTNLWLKADSIIWEFWLILSTFHSPYQVYPLFLSNPITKYIPNLLPLLVPLLSLWFHPLVFCMVYRNSHLPVLFAFTHASQHTFLYIIARNAIRSRNLVMLLSYRNPPIVFLNCDQGVSVWSAPCLYSDLISFQATMLASSRLLHLLSPLPGTLPLNHTAVM